MPELRSLARLARRSVAKAPGRSSLVVFVIALTVGAGVFAATFSRSFSTSQADREGEALGLADVAMRTWEIDRRADIEGLVIDPTGDGYTSFQTHFWVGGSGQRVISSTDLAHPLVPGLLDLHRGRAPAVGGEVALSTQALTDLGVQLGDVVELGPGFAGEWMVVGEVRHPYRRNHWEAVVVPSDMPALGIETSFVSLIARDNIDDFEGLISQSQAWGAVGITLRSDSFTVFDGNTGLDLSEPEQLSTFVSGTLLLQAATVAATAFAVGTRRRVTEFGQLAVIGASDRHIRVLVVLEAVVLASLGAAAGVLLGLGVAGLGAPGWASLAGRWHTGLEWSWPDLLGPVGVGLAAAVLAAWFPARRVAQLAPVQALAGRLPAAQFSPRLAMLSIVLVGGGLFVFGLTLADDSMSDLHAVLLGAAIVAIFIGTALGSGPLLALAGRSLRNVPGLARLVVRDSARQAVRSGAAVAALLIVVGVPVIVGTIVVSDERLEDDRRHLDEQFVFARSRVADVGIGDGTIRLDRNAALDELVGAHLASEAEVVSTATVRGGTLSITTTADFWQRSVTVGVLDEEVAAALDLDPSLVRAVDRGEAVRGNVPYDIGRLDSLVPLSGGEVSWGPSTPDGRNGYPLPVAWVSAEVAADLGVLDQELGVVHQLAEPPSDELLAAIRFDVAEAIFIENDDLERYRWFANDLVVGGREPTGLTASQVLAFVLLGSLVLGLLVALASAALSAVEIDRELMTMVAIGAPPSIRRRFIGLQSGYLTATAAILATPIAIAIVAVIFRANDDLIGVEANWPVLAAVLIGMPLVVGATMAVVFRSGRPAVSRRLS